MSELFSLIAGQNTFYKNWERENSGNLGGNDFASETADCR